MDVGNSYAKWRICDGQGNVRDSGSYPTSAPFPGDLKGVQRIRIASVAGPALRQALSAELQAASGVVPEFARAVTAQAGVTNSYPNPSNMGVDRWLALLAAHAQVAGPVIIVDAGTAITVDILSAEGSHAGGYIMPGLSLLAGALQAGTREVHFDNALQATLRPGVGTAQSVAHGVLLMAVSAIAAAVQEGLCAVGEEATVLLCGGDVAIMRCHLPVTWRHEPDLVLDGLALALP